VIAAEIVLILLMVLLNGFFSMSEMALVSAKPRRSAAAAARASRSNCSRTRRPSCRRSRSASR
jgi:CBS domain containing-hemolysin-like protein